MRLARFLFSFTIAIIAVVMCEAQFQPFNPAPGPIAPAPLTVALLSGIDDPIVIDELKLKDDQVKALVARRQELWDETYNTSPKTFAETAADRYKAIDAFFKKTLAADQYKRATQLAAQSLLRIGFGGFGGPDAEPTLQLSRVSGLTFNRYPELADIFQLTDAQKTSLAPTKQATFGGKTKSPSIGITKDQAASAKEFLGPVTKMWTNKIDPRITNRPTMPANFSLLVAKDVRTDLKLDEAKGKELLDLSEKWTKLATVRLTELSPKEGDAQAEKLKAETDKAMTGLTPKQLQRLKQIATQQEIGRFGGGFGGGFVGGGGGIASPLTPTSTIHIETAYSSPPVAQELKLTEEQQQEFAAIRQEFRDGVAATLEFATESAAAAKKIDSLIAERKKRAEGVLTAEQTTKWKDLIGEPFTGSVAGNRGGFGSSAGDPSIRAETFGKHSLAEFRFLATVSDVQKELKLTDKQIEKAAEIDAKIQNETLPNPPEPAARAKNFDKRSQMVADGLKQVLDEKQAQRFREIMLQYSDDRSASPFATASAARYPGVAEAVKLSEEQKKRLLAGDDHAQVLTEEQKTAIQQMLGKKFEGNLLTSFGGLGRTPFLQLSSVGNLLIGANAAAVETSLKLSDEQKKKLDTAREAYRKVNSEGPQGFGGEFATFAEARNAAVAAFEKAILETFTDEQKPRLAQIDLQSQAARDLFATLTNDGTAKKLNLTKEQRDKLVALNRDALELQRIRSIHLGFSPPTGENNLGLRMRDLADERLMAVLTDAQKKTWNELIGEPLKDLRKIVPNAGGFGGGLGGGFGPPPGGLSP